MINKNFVLHLSQFTSSECGYCKLDSIAHNKWLTWTVRYKPQHMLLSKTEKIWAEKGGSKLIESSDSPTSIWPWLPGSAHRCSRSQFSSTDVGMADPHHCPRVGGETSGTTISYNQELSNDCRVKKAYQYFYNPWHGIALSQLHSGQTIRLMWIFCPLRAWLHEVTDS